ncbi:MAG: insulinase family protein [Deltaproteobacteria bacterium]|nr:insulinase family protein [Deltaproteobacteria bacterium]MBW1952037.1 insulinase family protein [Deltaproteobacteria bacterium]MBW2134081.1 insulinase family protein [Deltaproteobacteria bacterium]
MNRKISILLIIVVFCLVGPGIAAPAEQVLGKRYQLPNGLVWLFSEQPDLPLVTMELLIKAGVLQEPPGKAGLANLTAALLLGGTHSRSATQIAEEIDFLGARLGAGGGQDYAVLRLTVLKKNLSAALKLFQDILFNPVFAPAEIARKVERFKGQLKSEQDEPGVVAARAFCRALYGSHPYGYPVIGTEADLPTITQADLVNFHRQYYRPNNAILAVVGDLRPVEAQQLIEKFFGTWASAPVPERELPVIPRLKQNQVLRIDKDITQAHIVLGQVGIKRRNPDFYGFLVMNYILGGGGFASRLMDNIRDNRGLAYSVASSFNPGVAAGPFEITLETKNATAGVALREALKEQQRIRTELVTDKELSEAKSYLIGSLPRKMDSNAKRAWLLGYVEFYGLGLDYPWRYPDLINRLTRKEIQTVAQKYLSPQQLLVVVGKQEKIELALPKDWMEIKKPPKAE